MIDKFKDFHISEAADSNPRAEAKKKAKELTKALADLEALIIALGPLGRDLDRLCTEMERMGDMEGAKKVSDAIGGFDGNFMHVLKDAYKYRPRNIVQILELGSFKQKTIKVPTAMSGLSEDAFNHVVNFVSQHKSGESVEYRIGYGISISAVGKQSSGWTSNNFMGNKFYAWYSNITPESIIQINRAIAKYGVFIEKISKEYKYIRVAKL